MEYGFQREQLQRYLDEQVYSLPGIERPQDKLSVILTGSRATGTYTPDSDVDIDVVCSEEDYLSIRDALISSGRISEGDERYFILPENDKHKYFNGLTAHFTWFR